MLASMPPAHMGSFVKFVPTKTFELELFIRWDKSRDNSHLSKQNSVAVWQAIANPQQIKRTSSMAIDDAIVDNKLCKVRGDCRPQQTSTVCWNKNEKDGKEIDEEIDEGRFVGYRCSKIHTRKRF